MGVAALGILGAAAIAEKSKHQDRRIRDEEKKGPKKMMKISLLIHIGRNYELLTKGSEPKGKYQHKAFWYILHSNTFESAISSDLYLMLSPHAQNKLSEYNEKVKSLNELTRKLNGEEEALKIQKINREQTPIMNELIRISADLEIILDENSI